MHFQDKSSLVPKQRPIKIRSIRLNQWKNAKLIKAQVETKLLFKNFFQKLTVDFRKIEIFPIDWRWRQYFFRSV